MSTSNSIRKHASFIGLIGVAQEDITPPVGIYARNWGAAKHDVAEGIHQPLKLTCITFQSSAKEKPMVLIGADLGWWKSSEDEWVLRNGLLKALALEPSQLMFCLSHTHAGPGICRDDASNKGGELIEPYLNHILAIAIRASKKATSTAKSATLTWQYAKCTLATNRDLWEPDKERFVVGFNPEKKADDTLLAGRITDDYGRILATIVNYACHPTTLAWDNRLISPDYIGSMREIVELKTMAPCLFLQGASGDLAPAEQYVGDTKVAENHGCQLGYAVLAAMEAMLPPQTQLSFGNVIESGAPLAVWERREYEASRVLLCELAEVELSLKPLPLLSDIEKQWHESKDRVLKERLWRQRGVRKAVGDGDHVLVGLWVWRLGDSILIGQPNEAYSQFQIQLREQFSTYAISVMNVVNGHIGYLPPEELYNKNIYSVWQTPFASGSLEILIVKAIAAVKNQLRKEKLGDK